MRDKALFGLLIFNEIKFWEPKRKGAMDFGLLFIFFTIIFTLSLLLMSTNRGLLDSLVDTFLSKNSDGNIPIHVTTNIGINEPISKDVLAELKEKTGLDADIFVEADSGQGKLYGFEKSKVKSWIGKFLLEDSYSWKKYIEDADTKGKNIIVLNRNSFRDHFDYKEYKEKLTKNMNVKLPNDIFALESLWLEFYFNNSKEFVEFDIVWVDNIYDVQEIDFLLPMDIMVKLKYISKVTNLDSVKSNINIREIIDSLNLSLYKDRVSIKLIVVEDNNILEKISKKFKGEQTDDEFEFSEYIRQSTLDSFLIEHGFDTKKSYEILDDKAYDQLELDGSEVLLSLKPNKLSQVDIGSINQKGDIKIVELLNGDYSVKVPLSEVAFVSHIISYAKGRDAIDKARDLIENFQYKDETTNYLMLDPLYKNSLRKLGFLSKILSELKMPYITILGLIFLFLIINQITMIISHRKFQYGILIAKGLERRMILSILMTQLSILLLVSALISFTLMKLVSWYLESSIIFATEAYRDLIDIDKLNILPISFEDLVIVVIAIFIVILLKVYWYLYKINILKKNGHIGELLRS